MHTWRRPFARSLRGACSRLGAKRPILSTLQPTRLIPDGFLDLSGRKGYALPNTGEHKAAVSYTP
jgi:hypothetical protein